MIFMTQQACQRVKHDMQWVDRHSDWPVSVSQHKCVEYPGKPTITNHQRLGVRTPTGASLDVGVAAVAED